MRGKNRVANLAITAGIFLGFMTPPFAWAADELKTPVTEINGKGLDIYDPTAKLGKNEKICTEPEVTEFYPIGDSSGKSILTRKDYIRECETTKTEQGKCIQWEEKKERRAITMDEYNSYETANFADSIGTLLSTLGGYDQIGHIWSGWHGYCETGTKSDFSWAKDPMFWASFAFSFLMDATAAPTDGAIKGAGEKAVTSEAGKKAAEQAGQKAAEQAAARGASAAQINAAKQLAADRANEMTRLVAENTMRQSGGGFLRQTAMGQAMQNSFTSIGNTAGGVVGKQFSNLIAEGVGRCITGGVAGVMGALYDYLKDPSGSGGISCDPVDEVCNADGTPGHAYAMQEDLRTIDSTQFYDAIEAFKKDNPNVNPYDHIAVIKESDGIVTYRFKSSTEIPGMEQAKKESQEKAQEMAEQMKKVQLGLNVALTTASTAGCITSATGTLGSQSSAGGGSASGGSSGSKSAEQARMGVGMVMSLLNSLGYLGPYGAIIAAVVKLAMQIATSFTKIDACRNKDDAQGQGPRQYRTYKALKFNLCHKIDKKCAQSNIFLSMFGKKCGLWGHYYCCYDQILTKVLVLQLKAQLGRGYGHCTGITLRDLNYVSLRQCSKQEKNNGFDGASPEAVKKDMKGSYQYKNKCVNMEEFMYYLQTTVGQDVTMDNFSNFWNEMSRQGLESGIKDPTYYNSETGK